MLSRNCRPSLPMPERRVWFLCSTCVTASWPGAATAAALIYVGILMMNCVREIDWKEIDVLVNNAGLALGLEPEYEGDFEDWDTMIDTNVKGLLTMTRLVVPGMVKRGCGQIINIGSVRGIRAVANAGGNVYCATKAAVKTITDGLRIDVADTALRVTNIKPGLVETNFSRTRFHGDNDRADNVYKGIKPLTGDDIADVALYAAEAPAHVQIAEVLVLATHQGSGSVIVRK